MKANEAFEFTLTAADNDTKTAIQEEKVKIAANGDKAIVAGAKDGVTTAFQFGDVTFTEEGIYTFNINETVPQTPAGGMTYDSHTAQVTIVVTRDTVNIGKLKATVSYNNSGAVSDVTDRAVFANRYDASTEVTGGTKADISAKKTLRGRNLRAGEFQFKLTTRPADGSNGTVLQEKQNGADGSIAFDSISYKTSDTAAGASAVVLDKAVEAGYAVKSTDADGNTVYTLSYRIYEDTENGTNSNGISVVTGTYDFTVTVTDHGNGVLTAVTNYPNEQNQFEFVNQYGTEPVPVEIAGSKTLAHDTSLTPADITGKFTFTLEALTEGAPMPVQTTAVNDAAGNVNFGEITFTTDFLQDAITTDNGVRTKEFEYKVTESGSAAGVTNDVNVSKTFKLTLTDDGNGNLSVTRNPADGPLFSFTNIYHVSELPSSITDQVKVNKTLEGRELKEGEFNFELVEDGNVVATGSNDVDGKVVFSSITYTQPGSHVYTVREVKGSETGITYDEQTYIVYTQITDNGDGTLSASHRAEALTDGGELAPVEGNAITFHNSYKAESAAVTIKAVKKLEGRDLKDGEFTFRLKDADGKVIAEAKNDASGTIRFENVKFEDEGVYEYTISEVNDKQTGITYDESIFKVTVKVNDNGEGTLAAEVSNDDIVFTNSYEAPKDDKTTDTPKKSDKNPDKKTNNPVKALRRVATGDNSHMMTYLVLMIAAIAVIGVVIVRRKKR